MDATIMALLIAAGGAVLTPVAAALGKFFSQAIQMQTLKLGTQKTDQLDAIVKLSISAAQQMKNSGQITDKKAFALNMSQKLIAQKKLKGVDHELLSAVIEASVWENMNAPTVSASVAVVPTQANMIPPVIVPPIDEKTEQPTRGT